MTKKTATPAPTQTLEEMKIKYAEIRLTVRAGKEKNTNAHKKLKKQIAQFLTKTK